MSKLEASYYQTAYWKEVRKAVYARDGGKCTNCGSPFNLHVHHESYAHAHDELEHLEDVVLLCRNCHNKMHTKQVKAQESKCPFCGDGRSKFPCNSCIDVAEECGYSFVQDDDLGLDMVLLPDD
jgi:hypothetical protein